MEFQIDNELKKEASYLVEQSHIANFLESEQISILSTPAMIGFMEHTCRLAVDSNLPPNYTTVGTLVNISHLAPVPIGEKILVKIKLKHQDRRKLVFHVECWWKNTKIGQGEHERFIVDKQKFLKKLRQIL
ncbi:MAG: thioesterase family protein [Candidatus Ranarchaeia archaeon]